MSKPRLGDGMGLGHPSRGHGENFNAAPFEVGEVLVWVTNELPVTVDDYCWHCKPTGVKYRLKGIDGEHVLLDPLAVEADRERLTLQAGSVPPPPAALATCDDDQDAGDRFFLNSIGKLFRANPPRTDTTQERLARFKEVANQPMRFPLSVLKNLRRDRRVGKDLLVERAQSALQQNGGVREELDQKEVVAFLRKCHELLKASVGSEY